jgi:heavy metal sensor kinase
VNVPVRLRLTLLYISLFAAAFLVVALLLHLLFSHSLYAQLDARLTGEARGTARLLEADLSAFRPPSPGWRGWPLAVEEDDDEPEVVEHLEAVQVLTPDIYLQLLDPTGRTLVTSGNLGDARLWNGELPSAGSRSLRHPALGRLRSFVLPVPSRHGTYRVTAASSLVPVESSIRTLHRLLLLALPLLLVAVGSSGYLLAARALQPVAAITDAARGIRAGDLSRRIALKGPKDELRHLADTFDDMIASLERLVLAQRQFLADASHELRTPLTVICTALETSLRTREPDAARLQETMKVLHAEARRMHRLVEDLLTLARADSGELPLERAPVQLEEVVKEACEAVEWMLERRRLRLDLEDEVTIAADADRLRQLVLNLLSNAAQHTPPDGEVQVVVQRSDGRALLTVRDNGEGIPPEHLPHVFERFYRADSARSSRHGGTGLGLAICRWIAEAHGGALSVQSERGRGTAFTASLPLG